MPEGQGRSTHRAGDGCEPGSAGVMPTAEGPLEMRPLDMSGAEGSWRSHLAQLREQFGSLGIGCRVGWGSSPVLLVVDLQLGFTDPACPLGVSQEAVVESSSRLAVAARSADVPVIYTVVSYKPDMSDAGIWPRKLPAQRFLVEDTRWVELDEGLGRHPTDRVVVKHHASGFFGTTLHSELTEMGVDTLVVCGCTTSGCVRASVVDACGLGYHTIVVRDAVGDRDPLVHEVSLFDIDTKYGDVVGEAEAVARMVGTGRDRG